MERGASSISRSEMPASRFPTESKLSHARILELAGSAEPRDAELVGQYLHEMARAFSVTEAFAVIALVDTPDVFD